MSDLVLTKKSKLQEQSSSLIEFFSTHLSGKNVHFFDVPVHTNTGDSLIFCGTLELLKEMKSKVVSWNSIYHRDVLAERKCVNIKSDDVIICQGGGNFGDIYERHQNLRKRLVSQYPENKIILFPQSMHFDDPRALENDLTFFGRAKNFYICVRDEYSFDTLKQNGVENAFLVPDIATCLVGKVNSINRPVNKEKLYFLRADVEAVKNSDLSVAEKSVDWEDINPKRYERTMYWLRRFASKSSLIGNSGLWWYLFRLCHRGLISNAVETFSSFRIIQTDRLHGMILSQLIGRPCEKLDNSYGKLRRYAQKWLEVKNNE